MQKHIFYRLVNIFILPVSAFIAIQVMMSLFIALANPAMLFGIFIIACVPIYAFTSNYFYNKSIRKGELCKPSLKDWIKVNAIVSIVFSVLAIFAGLGILVLLENDKALAELQEQIKATTPAQLSMDDLRKALKFYAYFFLPFSALLLIHIIITFTLLSRYKHMFGYSSNNPQ